MRVGDVVLLLEYDRGVTISRFSSKLGVFGDIEVVMDRLEGMDPTKVKKYVVWLIGELIGGRIRLEDGGRVRDVLEEFDKIKSRLGVDERDIGRMDFNRVEGIIDRERGVVLGGGDISNVDGVRVLYDGVYGFLGIPLTERASKELGRGTKWCTSGNEDNAFNDYNDRGELYVWRGRDGSKYQFFFGDGKKVQMRDARNREIGADGYKRLRDVPVLRELFKKFEEEVVGRKDLQDARQYVYRYWGENVYGDSPLTSYPIIFVYAARLMNKRVEAFESIILKDAKASAMYAILVLKRRWKEAESVIRGDETEWERYSANFDIRDETLGNRVKSWFSK